MIRPIQRCEIETCVEVIRKSFLTVAKEYGFTEENAPRFTAFATTSERLRFQYDEGRPMNGYFDDQGRLLGYYSLQMQGNEECELNNLCVLPEYRHRHIGEDLFSHAIKTAVDRGCTKVNIGIVEENKKLRAWYERLGAHHIGTKKFDFFPFTCGYMEKDISYHFYGHETAGNVKAKHHLYPGIETPTDLYDALSRIWCADTCAPRMRADWCGENKTLGQCSITAFLAQDIFGGEVYAMPTDNGGVHCYNVVNGYTFDLTSEQFGGKAQNLCYEGNAIQDRESPEHFGKEEKRQRYEYLKEELSQRRGDS